MRVFEAVRFEGEDLAGFSALLHSAPHLPYSYLPAASRAGCVALELARLQALHVQPEAETWAVYDAERQPAGLMILAPLPWDSGIYEMPMARIAALHTAPGGGAEGASTALAAKALERAQVRDWRFLDFQVHVSALPPLHAACRAGLGLMATHLTLLWRLQGLALPEEQAFVRVGRPEEVGALGEAAANAVPPTSRYAVDPRLSAGKAPEVFRQWASNSLKGYAERVYVADIAGELAGYCTWRVRSDVEHFIGKRIGVLDLTAVSPKARKQGVFGAMASAGLRWLQAEGFDFGEVTTHVLNAGMQRACGQLGATTAAARHTLHWHAPEA